MNKKYFAWLTVVVALGVVVVLFTQNNRQHVSSPVPVFDSKHSTFNIDGKSVTLVDGIYKAPAAPGSASMVTTRYFGNEATGDLNGDGLPDVAYLVSQDAGGSGTFFYVVVALKTATGYKTTNAYSIGDRIAPQTTEIHSDSQQLYVNYATRRPNEPMTARPSIGATLYLGVTPAGVLESVNK